MTIQDLILKLMTIPEEVADPKKTSVEMEGCDGCATLWNGEIQIGVNTITLLNTGKGDV